MQIKIGNSEYIVTYRYRTLAKTDILDRVQMAMTEESGSIRNLIALTAELLLLGLQKYHKDKFGFTTDNEKEEKLDAVYDLMDEIDNSTQDGNTYVLFQQLIEELTNNGFLSGAVLAMASVTETQEKPEQKKATKATTKK